MQVEWLVLTKSNSLCKKSNLKICRLDLLYFGYQVWFLIYYLQVTTIHFKSKNKKAILWMFF